MSSHRRKADRMRSLLDGMVGEWLWVVDKLKRGLRQTAIAGFVGLKPLLIHWLELHGGERPWRGDGRNFILVRVEKSLPGIELYNTPNKHLIAF